MSMNDPMLLINIPELDAGASFRNAHTDEINRLKELIDLWIDASEKWNLAMWQKDLTDSERSVIGETLVQAIRRLKAEVGR